MKTFYNPKMVADADSFSLSPLKPKLIAAYAEQKSPNSVLDFEPATVDQIKLAHDPRYVDGVFALKKPNGFGNCEKEVADSLPWTVGSMIHAVRYVTGNKKIGQRVALSPTSGFHHAGYADGGGYCTFNGLVISLLVARAEGRIKTATIIDGDQHWGDGTEDIIKRLGLDWITHWSGQRHDVAKYHQEFRLACREACKTDLVIYQAGADIHVEDPLGGLLTTQDMIQRDRYVLGSICKMKPLVWNLAGGYRLDKQAKTIEGKLEPVMALHRNTYDILSAYRED